jgi:uroporphyrinogen III methyltransferase/synthase
MSAVDQDLAPSDPARPLLGKRVLVLRTKAQAGRTSALLRARGAEPIEWPVLEVVAPPDPDRVRRAVVELSSYDLVAFTSENGVAWFAAALRDEGRGREAFGRARVAAVGPGTAVALAAHGIGVDLLAAEFVGEGLATAILQDRSIQARLVAGERPRVLLPRALVARQILPDALRRAGCDVDVVAVYETRPASLGSQAALQALLERGGVDIALLTSSSTVAHLCALLGDRAPALLAPVVLASIGPITTEEATRRGLTIGVTADASTLEALVDALDRPGRASA